MAIQLDDDYGEFVRVGGICYRRIEQSQKLPDFIGGPEATGFSDCEDCQATLSESTSSESSSSTAIFSSSSINDSSVANFNGINHSFSVASNSQLQLPTNMKWTFTGWIIPDSILGTQHLISKFSDANLEYNISIDAQGRMRVCVFDSSDNAIVDTITVGYILTIGKMVNFAVVANGNSVAIYIDGQVQAQDLFTGTPKQSTSDFRLGAKNGDQFHYDGALFDVNYWHRALTYEEVNIIYNEGMPYGCACIGEVTTEISSMSSGFLSSSSESSSSTACEFNTSSSLTLSESFSSESSSESSSSTEGTLITGLISCWDLSGDSLDKFGSNDLTNNNSVPFDRFVNQIQCENSSSSI